MCDLERIFQELQSGTNYRFLAQGVQKWWLKQGKPINGGGDILVFLPLFPIRSILWLRLSRFQKIMCDLERIFQELQSGTNYRLTQGVQKWWFEQGKRISSGCDNFYLHCLFAYLLNIWKMCSRHRFRCCCWLLLLLLLLLSMIELTLFNSTIQSKLLEKWGFKFGAKHENS